MHWLELKIPPLALLFMTMALMLGSTWLFPTGTLSSLRWWLLGIGSLLGGGISLLGVLAFKRAQTTVLPYRLEQSSTLVTAGIYRYTRNPMYVGFVIFLLGFAGLLGSVWALFWIGAFVAYLTQFQIKPEEKILQEKFSQQYKNYRQRVRRWI